MKLAAQRPESLLEIGEIEIQSPRHADERKVVALPPERQNPGALRTEVRIYRRSAAAASTNLDDGTRRDGRHLHGASCVVLRAGFLDADRRCRLSPDTRT